MKNDSRSICCYIIDSIISSLEQPYDEDKNGPSEKRPRTKEVFPQSKIKPDFTGSKLRRLQNSLNVVTNDRDFWKSQCMLARSQCESEGRARNQLTDRLEEAMEEIEEHLNFCSKMGAELTDLIWTISQDLTTTQKVLSEAQMSKFFKLVLGTLENAFESSGVQNLDTLRFIHGLLGSTVNLTATSKGRSVLAEQELMENLVEVVHDVLVRTVGESNDGKLIKLCLMILFNLSLWGDGCQALENDEHVMNTLEKMTNMSCLGDQCVLAEKILGSVGRPDENVPKKMRVSAEIAHEE